MCYNAHANLMLLTKLELSNFRNYSQISFLAEPRMIIVGPNGEGKTNLLEALFLLIKGRSFRANYAGSFVQYEKPSAKISAEFFQGGNRNIIEMFLNREGKKKIFFNGKPSLSSFLNHHVSLILFSPESLSLLKGSSEKRRLWLDHWLGMQGNGKCVREFRKVLIQKNQLLRQIKSGHISKKQGQSLLESVNYIFVQKSLALSRAREKSLQELDAFFLERAKTILRNRQTDFGQKPAFRLQYMNKVLNGNVGDVSFEEERRVLAKLEETAFLEQERGSCLFGAHQDDFQVLYKEKDAKYFCSQGEQRALLIALKKAQIQWIDVFQKRPSLLLLDDVFSEMDKHRVLNLLDFLQGFPTQMILTSTEVPTLFFKKHFRVFSLKKGTLLREKEGERRNNGLQSFFEAKL